MKALLFASVVLLSRVNGVMPTMDTIWANVCKSSSYIAHTHTQTQTVTYDVKPYNFLYGYALGNQVDPYNITTTCYTQVRETWTFID
jgi:hypothetical protein